MTFYICLKINTNALTYVNGARRFGIKKVLEGLGFFFPSNLVVYILCSLENDKLFLSDGFMSVLKAAAVITRGMKCPLKKAILLALWASWVQ